MGLNFIYIFCLFFTYIILFTQYAGLYIANFDELQTICYKPSERCWLRLIWWVIKCIHKKTRKYVHLHLSIKRTRGKRKHKEQECAENMQECAENVQECAEMCKNMQKCANVKYNYRRAV